MALMKAYDEFKDFSLRPSKKIDANYETHQDLNNFKNL